MNQTTVVLFDLGNVLIDLDIQATERAILSHLLPSDNLKSITDKIFIDYEVGAFDEKTFLSKLKGLSKPETTESDLLDAWNAMLIDFPVHRLSFLEEVATQYKVMLFSNTNFTHLNWVNKHLQDKGINNWDDKHFEKAFYSHILKDRKPNVQAFKKVIDLIGHPAQEIMFIDDNADNIAGAELSGMKTAHHDPSNEISDIFDRYIFTKSVYPGF
jgi:glucose-1-phosphatase